MSKILNVRLPADHFIFKVQAGDRSDVARYLLDTGNQICNLEQQISNLETKLLNITETLNFIKENQLQTSQPEHQPVKKTILNIEAALDK